MPFWANRLRTYAHATIEALGMGVRRRQAERIQLSADVPMSQRHATCGAFGRFEAARAATLLF